MPRHAMLDRTIGAIVQGAVKAQLRDVIAPLVREVRKLQRKVDKLRTVSVRAGGGSRRGGRRAKYATCQVTGCSKKHLARGFCLTHYNRYKQQGTLLQYSGMIEAGKPVGDIRRRAAAGSRAKTRAGGKMRLARRASRKPAKGRRPRRRSRKG